MLSSRLSIALSGIHGRKAMIIGMVQRKTVTDISYYREVDQSHLHQVPAQSYMRKFMLKLQEEEMKKARELERQAQKDAENANLVDSRPGSEVVEREKIQVPEYIERKPSEVLKAICSEIGRDYTAPDYRFHDDPYLIPYQTAQKRNFLLSKEGGKRAARYILQTHPELFENNLIEASPKIKAFMPRIEFSESKASVDLLRTFIEGFNVSEAIKTFEFLHDKREELDSATLQDLLELVAFNKGNEGLYENHYELAGLFFEEKNQQMKNNTAIIEKIYSKLENETPEARITMLCSLVKMRDYKRANEFFEKCKAKGDQLNTLAYNAAIRCFPQKKNPSQSWNRMLDLFREMQEQKCKPDQDTLLSALKSFNNFSTFIKDNDNVTEKVKDLLAEFRTIGIKPCLSSYMTILEVFTHREMGNAVIPSIIADLKSRDWSIQLIREEDPYLFELIMKEISKKNDLKMAYEVIEMIEKNHLDRKLYTQPVKTPFVTFVNMVLKLEDIDVAMQCFNKYIPHMFSPSSFFFSNLLQKVKKVGAFRHLPRVWTDMRLSDFCGAPNDVRLNLLCELMNTITAIDLSLHSDATKDLKQNLAVVAKEVFDIFSETVDPRKKPMHELAQSSVLCDRVIKVAIDYDDYDLVKKVMSFCKNNAERIPDNLSELTIEEIMSMAVDRKDKATAKDCVIYTAEQSLKNSLGVAEKFADNFEINEMEKRQLNQFYAHDSKWQVLQ